MLLNELAGESFVSDPDLVNLPLVALSQEHLSWEVGDRATRHDRASESVRIGGHAVQRLVYIAAPGDHRLTIHAVHLGIATLLEEAASFGTQALALLSDDVLPHFDDIVVDLLKCCQIVIVPDTGQFFDQIGVVLLFRLFIANYLFEVLLSHLTNIFHVNLKSLTSFCESWRVRFEPEAPNLP